MNDNLIFLLICALATGMVYLVYAIKELRDSLELYKRVEALELAVFKAPVEKRARPRKVVAAAPVPEKEAE